MHPEQREYVALGVLVDSMCSGMLQNVQHAYRIPAMLAV